MDYKCIYSIYPNLEGIQKDGSYKNYTYLKTKKIYNVNCLFQKKINFYEGETSKKESAIILYLSKNQEYYKFHKIQYYILYRLKYKIISYKKKNDDINYFFYKKQNFNDVLKYIYIQKYVIEQDFENNYINNMNIFIKYMATQYYLFKLKFNVPDKEFFINIFYRFYIFVLKDEIIKKYGKDIITDFENYHSIYLFLKEKNYVSLFYTKIKKEIIKEYNNFKNFIKDKENDINNIKKIINNFSFGSHIKKNLNISKKNINNIDNKIKNLQNNEK